MNHDKSIQVLIGTSADRGVVEYQRLVLHTCKEVLSGWYDPAVDKKKLLVKIILETEKMMQRK